MPTHRFAPLFALLVLLTLPMLAPAQEVSTTPVDETPGVGEVLASPRDVMQAFLSSINRVDNGYEEAWPQVLACFDFSPKASEDERKETAHQLLDFLNRLGRLDVMDLPGRAAVAPGVETGEEPITRYQFFPSPAYGWVWEELAKHGIAPQGAIVLREVEAGSWRFDRQTTREIPLLHESTRLLPPKYADQQNRIGDSVITLFGPTFQRTPMWAWGALLGLILIGLIIGKTVQTVLRSMGERLIKKGWEVRGIVFDNAASPASFACLSLGLVFGLALITMEPALRQFSNKIVQFLLILACGWFLFNLVEVIDTALRRMSEKTQSKLDDQLVPLVRKALRIFLVVVFTLFVAQNVFGLDITGWLAGLGIAGLAISLAAQDSIKNLFGSITVLFDKPFTVGDWIVTEGLEGTVEEVGFRSTRIRTFYNSLITLPNANLINASVDNYGRRQYRRWKTHIGVQYDTTPDQLLAFTEGIRELVRTHPYTRKDYFQVWCHEFDDSSLNILLYVFHEVPDWSTELRERERLFIDIVRLADQLGVSFAFPTQTVHLYKEEHKPHEVQHEKPKSTTDRRSMIQGIRAAQELVKDQPWRNNAPGPVEYRKGPTDLKIDEHGNPVIE